MAKIIVMKRGVGDHTDERCPPHEAEASLAVLRAMTARMRVNRMMAESLAEAAKVQSQ